MLSIYNDNNGTAKLLTYMLDNLQGMWSFVEQKLIIQAFLFFRGIILLVW